MLFWQVLYAERADFVDILCRSKQWLSLRLRTRSASQMQIQLTGNANRNFPVHCTPAIVWIKILHWHNMSLEHVQCIDFSPLCSSLRTPLIKNLRFNQIYIYHNMQCVYLDIGLVIYNRLLFTLQIGSSFWLIRDGQDIRI